jgi:hypothetical protein
MRFHIDTRSAAASDVGSTFDTRTNTDASGGAKFGPWGMEAKVQSTIGYVSTQRSQTTEELNTDLELSSNVELLFKTDYVSLDRLAGGPAQERIRVNAMNPEAEAKLAQQDRAGRQTATRTAEATRSSQLKETLTPSPKVPGVTPTPQPEKPAPVKPNETPPPQNKTPPPAPDKTAPPAQDKTAPPAQDKTAAPAKDKTAPPTQDKTAPAKPPAPSGDKTAPPGK